VKGTDMSNSANMEPPPTNQTIRAHLHGSHGVPLSEVWEGAADLDDVWARHDQAHTTPHTGGAAGTPGHVHAREADE